MNFSRRSVLQMGPLASAGLGLAGCFGSSVTRRIKVIAMAEVDGKAVEASSVYELTWKTRGSNVHAYELGEAVVLELPGRGTVFVLDGRNIPGKLLYIGAVWNWQVEHLVGSEAHLNPELFAKVSELSGRHPYHTWRDMIQPLMVAFKDEKRFRSIYEVKAEDFPRLFGGAKFKGIDFEFTDEPVTKLLEQRLPCLKPPYESPPREVLYGSNGKYRAAKDIPFTWSIGPEDFLRRGP